MKTSWASFVSGSLVIIACLVGGYFLDDLHIDPFFGFRTEGISLKTNSLSGDSSHYGFDQVIYEVVGGGAGSPGVEVNFRLNGQTLIAVGGNESTYVGLKDIDNDGTKELLVTSLNVFTEKGVWKFSDGNFVKIEPNLKARTILKLATILHYSLLFVLGGIFAVMFGLAGILGNKPQRRVRPQ